MKTPARNRDAIGRRFRINRLNRYALSLTRENDVRALCHLVQLLLYHLITACPEKRDNDTDKAENKRDSAPHRVPPLGTKHYP